MSVGVPGVINISAAGATLPVQLRSRWHCCVNVQRTRRSRDCSAGMGATTPASQLWSRAQHGSCTVRRATQSLPTCRAPLVLLFNSSACHLLVFELVWDARAGDFGTATCSQQSTVWHSVSFQTLSLLSTLDNFVFCMNVYKVAYSCAPLHLCTPCRCSFCGSARLIAHLHAFELHVS